jgi:pimeloyl-ACP methyl ester carboxylesterase
MWADAAMELARHGRCIIYDRRGFHRSAPPVPFETLDLVDHVDDAAAVLAGLHAGPAVVIGRSTGGLIAIELACRFPDKVKALVLLEPALFTIDPDAEAWARGLRLRVLERSAGQPGLLPETVFRPAAASSTPPIRRSWTSWTALPPAPTPGPSRDVRSANRAGREIAHGPRPYLWSYAWRSPRVLPSGSRNHAPRAGPSWAMWPVVASGPSA